MAARCARCITSGGGFPVLMKQPGETIVRQRGEPRPSRPWLTRTSHSRHIMLAALPCFPPRDGAPQIGRKSECAAFVKLRIATFELKSTPRLRWQTPKIGRLQKDSVQLRGRRHRIPLAVITYTGCTRVSPRSLPSRTIIHGIINYI